MQPDFDRARFAEDVEAWRGKRGLSYRAAGALHPCLNLAMISRACNQRVLSVPSMLLICHVFGLDPLRYLVAPVSGSFQRNQTVTAVESRETSGAKGGPAWA
jgi:hypothetical protein